MTTTLEKDKLTEGQKKLLQEARQAVIEAILSQPYQTYHQRKEWVDAFWIGESPNPQQNSMHWEQLLTDYAQTMGVTKEKILSNEEQKKFFQLWAKEDYLYQMETIGYWAQARLHYLMDFQEEKFQNLLTNKSLEKHLLSTQEQAQQQMETAVKKSMDKQGLTQAQVESQPEYYQPILRVWRAQTKEQIDKELIYPEAQEQN
ncbi:MAG: TnpV protein [Coriobacteriia bacterium]|jgi:hypothetical protein|nr:TnpV protein [Coriobacteriia bacterium]